MASKFGMAGGIPERRVRPVWDAIDSRQFKNALRLSTSLLAKYPNYPYALALKALILERMGKSEEALSVCIHAKELLYANDSILMDDLTLSTLQSVFQRLDHLDMATSCYEHACGKFPNNLELMTGLFNCYVREYSFVKQQQIAIKMYKTVGEERFLLWAVCSIQLQVFCGNGGEKLLLLAEALLKKHITSHSLHEPEALSVYISLLEQQSKYRDALEILSGNLGSLIMIEVDKLRMQGRLLARAGDYAAAADVYQKVLQLCSDDWESFQYYLSCLLEDHRTWYQNDSHNQYHQQLTVDGNHIHLTDEEFDSRMSSASDFVCKLLEEDDSDSIRCPRLAKLEIEKRKLFFGKGSADKLLEGLMVYFSRFGHLACFTSDIEDFLGALTHEKKRQFLEDLATACEPFTTNPKKALGQSVTLFKVRELIGDLFGLPVVDIEGFAVKMAEMYFKNLPLSKDLDVQESMYGEELLSMTCNLLVQLFWRTSDLGYLLEAILFLELGLAVRRYVWQYNILLLHLYSHWGALPLAYERYKSLDVKNILLETVSHHIVPQMLVSPLWLDLSDLLRDYLKFMDDHFRESADLTFLAYRHRNYSKVIEFVQFKEKLQRSSQYLVTKVEEPILQLKQNANSIEEEESVLKSLDYGIHFVDVSNEIRNKELTFNENLQSRPWWTPTYDRNYLLGSFEGISYHPKEITQNEIKQTETNVRKTTERRSLLPRLIYLSIQCASSSSKESIEDNISSFNPKVSLELKTLLDRYAKLLGFPFKDAVEQVLEVSRGQKSFEVITSDLIDLMNFIVFLNAWNLNSQGITSADQEEPRPCTWHLVHSLLEKCISQKTLSIQPLLSSTGTDLSILIQLVTEPLSWHSLVIQSALRSYLNSGKKKKKGGPTERSNSQIPPELKNSISSFCCTVEGVIKWLKEQINWAVERHVEVLLSALEGRESGEGPGKIFKILQNSVELSDSAELGERITGALRSWKPVDVVEKILTAQRTVMMEFLKICEAKLKAMQALQVHV